MRLRVVFTTLVALGLACTATQVARQVAPVEYATALQGCIATAKATDGGFAAYERCAEGVDKTFRSDGGAP